MSNSSKFLDNLLDSAITFYSQNDTISKKPLPVFFNNIDEAVDLFENSLRFEANEAMSQEIIVDSLPILHAANLDTNTPGIITGETKKKKLILHKKKKPKKKNSKPKKEKTPEQLEIEMLKLQKKEEEKQKKEETKKIEKDENVLAKHERKVAKEIEKEAKKAKALADKLMQKAKTAQDSIANNKDVTPKQKEKTEIMAIEADKAITNAQEKQKEYEIADAKATKIQDKVDNRKIERQKKRETTKKEKEKKAIERAYQKEQKKKKLEKDLIDKNINLHNDIFDLVEETMLSNNDELDDGEVEVSADSIKIYPSPLPFYRHINSLNMTRPFNGFEKTLLQGEPTEGDCFIKLYHGPPGTGKTFRLMKELSQIIGKKKFNRILVCATSNIATVNMYTRAKKMGIKGSLVISNEKYYQPSPKELEEWQPTTDSVVFSTISMRSGSILRDCKFTTILIDEASQCQEAWIWGLLREEVKYIYMAGDPQQLSALVSQKGESLKNGRSLMERLMSMDYPAELLNTQRRMHPKIAEFSNITFYDNKLKTEYHDNYDTAPFQVINIQGKEKRVGTSYQNEIEAIRLDKEYKKLSKEFKQVIVISPYQAQCKLINKINPEINIHTVDSFQGREADVVLMTTVRSENKIGFWNDYRRLNVGMTRAKHVLRIIGNINTWDKEEGPLKKLKKYVINNNLVEEEKIEKEFI
ncbi:AAA domain [seawater metagenome]|uniref:AAA domain n=1 Tax=seawater metagenome TaxID=1561972 RepID=A0A5E8CGW1_9ZZZZ